MVSTRLPATVAVSVRQDSAGLSSISTVQAPHSPPSQPVLVPVRPIFSRRKSSNRMLSATASARSRPLSVNSRSRVKCFFPVRRVSAIRASSDYAVTTHQQSHPLQTHYREWLGRLPAVRGRLPKSGNDIARNGDAADLVRIVLVTRRPDPGLGPVHRQFAADGEPVLDVETGAAELRHPRGDIHHVAEFRGFQEIGARVHQRNTDDAEGFRQLMRRHAERGFEQHPGADVEHLEKAAVEHDAGRVALAPFDGQLSAECERRHANCLRPIVAYYTSTTSWA